MVVSETYNYAMEQQWWCKRKRDLEEVAVVARKFEDGGRDRRRGG